ncbi:MAG: CotH kinase family protein, partial [Saprospiraceae bacterium]
MKRFLTCLLALAGQAILLLLPAFLFSQSVDHWETVFYNNDLWNYRIGDSEPPADWMMPGFNDSQWPLAPGGFGYGDGDDNTTTVNIRSIYIRREFELVDTSNFDTAILHADYDDAFVAYINGVEVARSGNIGSTGIPPTWNTVLSYDHEATLYFGGQPEEYILSGADLKDVIQEGTNTIAIQINNVDESSSDFSSNFFFSVGIKDETMTYGDIPDWFNPPFVLTSLISNLPIINISTTTTTDIFDEPKVPAHMGIVYNGPGELNSFSDPYNHYDGNISIEIRGASSQTFPKKNYGFETQLEDGSNNNISLFGMPEENDWILHGPYADKSLLRNVLAYHMGTSTGRYTPRTQLCELVINANYKGVYMFTERIKRDKNRVDISTLRPEDTEGDELTGGYIFQIDRDDEDITGEGWTSNYPDFKFFAYNDPDYEELLPIQKNYIRTYMDNFESDMNDSDYATKYLDYLNVDSWVDYFLINEVAKHIDAFKLSFYMYKKKDSNGGKIHFGPLWDFNLGFGNFDFDCSPDPQGWSYLFRGTCANWHPFWVKRLVEIPNVSHQTNCRWAELREGPLHTDSLLQFLDANVLLLEDAQVRNFNRWPILGNYVWPNNFIGNNYDEEILYLRNWLINRLNWMDNNMIGDCDQFVSGAKELTVPSQVTFYPN